MLPLVLLLITQDTIRHAQSENEAVFHTANVKCALGIIAIETGMTSTRQKVEHFVNLVTTWNIGTNITGDAPLA